MCSIGGVGVGSGQESVLLRFVRYWVSLGSKMMQCLNSIRLGGCVIPCLSITLGSVWI